MDHLNRRLVILRTPTELPVTAAHGPGSHPDSCEVQIRVAELLCAHGDSSASPESPGVCGDRVLPAYRNHLVLGILVDGTSNWSWARSDQAVWQSNPRLCGSGEDPRRELACQLAEEPGRNTARPVWPPCRRIII